MGQTPNNSTIIKSITIIIVYVSQLKKNLFCFSLLSHTHYLSLSKVATLCFLFFILFSTHSSLLAVYFFSKWLLLGYSLLFLSCAASSFFALAHTLFVSSRRQQYLTLSLLLRSSQAKILFLSLGFTLYFPFSHREDPWAKAIKFFVALSIYKTFLLFSFELEIHYIINKESTSFHTKE